MALAGLEWIHPWRLALLGLPFLVLFFARRGLQTERRMIATLALWQQVALHAPSAAQRRRGPIPLALICACVGLALCALALAGPSFVHRTGLEAWRIVVDRSPSMYLADGASTRLAVALDQARAFFDERGIAASEREWIDATSPIAERVQSPELPRTWLAAPSVDRKEVSWTSFDQPRVLWLTDQASIAPRTAMAIESGGPAVPGVVSLGAGKLWSWDGGTGLRASAEPLSGRVMIDGTLAAPLEELLRAWCELDGLTCVRGEPDATTLLALRGVGAAAEREATLAIGGAQVRVRFAGATDRVPDGFERERWLAAGDATLVDWRPGEIRTTLTAFEFVAGEKADIAVAFGELFQRALRLSSTVVPLTERLAAGEPRRIDVDTLLLDRDRAPTALAAALAGLGAALFALAWLVRARRA